MPLSKTERLLQEAVKNMLADQDRIGLANLSDEEHSHTAEYHWERVYDEFRLKVADSPFADAISSAFYAVHTHKYVDDPKFVLSFKSEMASRGLPRDAIETGLKAYKELAKAEGMDVDELPEEPIYVPRNRGHEFKDKGWPADMKEIRDITSNADDREPKTSKPYTGGGPAPAATIS